MTGDLFSSEGRPEQIRAPGGDLQLYRDFDLGGDPAIVCARLISETPWRQESVVVWGKRHLQPRLVAWYGDEGRRYSYSGIGLDPLPWTELLASIRQRVEARLQISFNSVLLNYYRNGSDSMGFHSDDELELGDRPIIASLSLGQERTFVLKSKRENFEDVKIRLASGSLLLMKGDTQKNWKHGIAKEAGVLRPRVNLTFRTIFAR